MLSSMIPDLQKECFENQGELGAKKELFFGYKRGIEDILISRTLFVTT